VQSGTGADTVKNFLGALAENNRLDILPGVAEKFAVLMSAAKGEIEMTVTSATVRAVAEKLGMVERMVMADLINVYRLWITKRYKDLRLPSRSRNTSDPTRSSGLPTRWVKAIYV